MDKNKSNEQFPNQKLTLDDLEVDSFVVSLDDDEARDLLGGCTPCRSRVHCQVLEIA